MHEALIVFLTAAYVLTGVAMASAVDAAGRQAWLTMLFWPVVICWIIWAEARPRFF